MKMLWQLYAWQLFMAFRWRRSGRQFLAFKGVAHRTRINVAEKNGVVYYNDSKGTNPDAAIKAIQAMRRPTILLGGGYDKDSEYTEWINSFDGKSQETDPDGCDQKKRLRETVKNVIFMIMCMWTHLKKL